MDRERDTGQYLSCHHERRRKLAAVKGLRQLSKSNQGMGNDPRQPKPASLVEPDSIRLYFKSSTRKYSRA
jgi:hypothetical protein